MAAALMVIVIVIEVWLASGGGRFSSRMLGLYMSILAMEWGAVEGPLAFSESCSDMIGLGLVEDNGVGDSAVESLVVDIAVLIRLPKQLTTGERGCCVL